MKVIKLDDITSTIVYEDGRVSDYPLSSHHTSQEDGDALPKNSWLNSPGFIRERNLYCRGRDFILLGEELRANSRSHG